VLLALGRADEAIERHLTALQLAKDVGNRRELARAHDGLGRAYAAAGHGELADDHLRLALEIYVKLGGPEAEDVRARRAALGSVRS
jgi:hypothetical protein